MYVLLEIDIPILVEKLATKKTMEIKRAIAQSEKITIDTNSRRSNPCLSTIF